MSASMVIWWLSLKQKHPLGNVLLLELHSYLHRCVRVQCVIFSRSKDTCTMLSLAWGVPFPTSGTRFPPTTKACRIPSLVQMKRFPGLPIRRDLITSLSLRPSLVGRARTSQKRTHSTTSSAIPSGTMYQHATFRRVNCRLVWDLPSPKTGMAQMCLDLAL